MEPKLQPLDIISKMKKILLVFILFLSLNSCTTGPEFNRNNENDPGSANYNPSLLDIPDRFYEVNNTRHLEVEWNNTEFISGVLISKKQQNESNFEEFLTLSSDQDSFVDSSATFTEGTVYKYDFFRLLDDNSRVFATEAQLDTLRFSPFIDIAIENAVNFTRIRATQLFNRKNPLLIAYFDGVEVSVNYPEIDSEWELLNDIKFAKFGFDVVTSGWRYAGSFSSNLAGNYRLQVVQYIYDVDGSKLPLSTYEESFNTTLD